MDKMIKYVHFGEDRQAIEPMEAEALISTQSNNLIRKGSDGLLHAPVEPVLAFRRLSNGLGMQLMRYPSGGYQILRVYGTIAANTDTTIDFAGWSFTYKPAMRATSETTLLAPELDKNKAVVRNSSGGFIWVDFLGGY